ncbi:MAG: BrnT family toxin [Acidobacteria bacterium]|nr:BrnT family toxin [Acidobacteriota bacterium]
MRKPRTARRFGASSSGNTQCLIQAFPEVNLCCDLRVGCGEARTNQRKHAVSFEEAASVYLDPTAETTQTRNTRFLNRTNHSIKLGHVLVTEVGTQMAQLFTPGRSSEFK